MDFVYALSTLKSVKKHFDADKNYGDGALVPPGADVLSFSMSHALRLVWCHAGDFYYFYYICNQLWHQEQPACLSMCVYLIAVPFFFLFRVDKTFSKARSLWWVFSHSVSVAVIYNVMWWYVVESARWITARSSLERGSVSLTQTDLARLNVWIRLPGRV